MATVINIIRNIFVYLHNRKLLYQQINRELRLLYAVNGLFVFSANMVGPLYAIFVQRFISDPVLISLSVSVFFISSTVFSLILAQYDDFKDKEFLLSFGYFLRFLCWGMFIFANSFAVLVVLQILLGLAEAVGTTAFDTIFAEHLDKNKHVKDYAYWKAISNPTIAGAVVIGGLIVENFGFEVLFAIKSSIALFCAISYYRYHKKIKTDYRMVPIKSHRNPKKRI